MGLKTHRILLIVILLNLVLVFPVAAANIGYVDLDFLFNAHPEYNSKNQEFVVMVEHYAEEFQKASAEINDEAQFNAIVDDYDEKIADAANELRRYILESMSGYIDQVAENNDIDVVLISSTILYGGIDLTDLVVKEMYSAYGISVPSHLRN